jgi:uncharacterized protein (DUF4415 family)
MGEPMKKSESRHDKEIETLKRMKDEQIDLTEIPETPDWSRAVVGKFYRPIKRPLTIRVDADVLAWLKAQGKGYQTRINALLREAMESARSGDGSRQTGGRSGDRVTKGRRSRGAARIPPFARPRAR